MQKTVRRTVPEKLFHFIPSRRGGEGRGEKRFSTNKVAREERRRTFGGTQSSPRNLDSEEEGEAVNGKQNEKRGEKEREKEKEAHQPAVRVTNARNETDFSIVLSSLASSETIQGVPSAPKANRFSGCNSFSLLLTLVRSSRTRLSRRISTNDKTKEKERKRGKKYRIG